MNNFPRMHVSLYVSDIEQSIQFYDAFFGQKATKVENRYAKYVLDAPALIISFIEKPEEVRAKFGHLGFQLETKELLVERSDAIRAKKLPIVEEMGVSCCFALQDKFWVSDPDGYRWEIYYFHKDVAFNDPHYELQPKEEIVKSEVSQLQTLAVVDSNCGCAPTCCN